MDNRYRKLIVIIFVLIIIVIAVCFCQIERGTYFTQYLFDREVIAKITLEKTNETSEGVESFGVIKLSEMQRTYIFQKMEQSFFCHFHSSTWDTDSSIRYKIVAYNEREVPVVMIKVYDGKYFIFDYTPGTSKAVHKKFVAMDEDWDGTLDRCLKQGFNQMILK